MSNIIPENIIYRGFIDEMSDGDHDDALWLRGSEAPLASIIKDHMEELGNFLSVKYHITDIEVSSESLNDTLIRTMTGIGGVEYEHAYSEYTGYLWTNQDIKVGGHDLLDILEDNKGKFLHMEISFSKVMSK